MYPDASRRVDALQQMTRYTRGNGHILVTLQLKESDRFSDSAHENDRVAVNRRSTHRRFKGVDDRADACLLEFECRLVHHQP